jgi:hypothetical protein
MKRSYFSRQFFWFCQVSWQTWCCFLPYLLLPDRASHA